MTIQNVIELAAGCLGRDDLIVALGKNVEERTEEERTELDALLRAFNFVENETALDYCPLKQEEKLDVIENKIFYNDFSKTPVYIRKVVCGGGLARFAPRSAYVLLTQGWQGSAEVTYDYIPKTKTEFSEVSEFTDTNVSARLLSYGVASQYLIVNGETGRAAIWDKKYREALRSANVLKRTVSVRSRRWV